MNRVIALIVLAAFFPLQVYAAEFDGFRTDTNYESFHGRPQEKSPEEQNQAITETILEGPIANRSSRGINWYMVGGVGLAAVAIGLVAIIAGGGKGGGGAPAGPVTTSTVTGSW